MLGVLLGLVEKGKPGCSLGLSIPQAAWLATEPCRANNQLKGKKNPKNKTPLLHVWAPSLQSGLSKQAARDSAVFHPKLWGKHRFEGGAGAGGGGRDSKAGTFSLATNLLPASLCLAAPRD